MHFDTGKLVREWSPDETRNFILTVMKGKTRVLPHQHFPLTFPTCNRKNIISNFLFTYSLLNQVISRNGHPSPLYKSRRKPVEHCIVVLLDFFQKQELGIGIKKLARTSTTQKLYVRC